MRELEEHAAQLAGLGERPKRVDVQGPDPVDNFGGRRPQIEARIVRHCSRQPGTCGLRKTAGVDRMVRQQPEGLDVKNKARRRALRPQPRVLLRRRGVERRIDLDQRELACVVA